MFRAGVTQAVAGAAATPGFADAAPDPRTLLCDISAWQPDIADAAYLAWSKAVVIRALYGTAVDGAWYGGARRANLHAGGARFVGIYQYLTPGQPGAAQAQALRDLAGPIQAGEVLIADFEEGARSTLTDWYDTMLALYGPGIRPYLWTYAGLWFGGSQGALPVEWIAAYQAGEPATPHKLWQFSPSYPVPGVGVCDCNLFHGTIDDLAALAWQGTPAPPPAPAADWTYGPPRNLHAAGGHTSAALTWQPPDGAPVPPDHYVIWLYRGTAATAAALVPSYPRDVAGSPWQGGGLTRGQVYSVHVAASGPGSGRLRPDCFASAAFTTG